MLPVRLLVLVAVTTGLLGCSDRPVEIEEEGESHRHLAEAYCRDWCTFWYDCEPVLANSSVAECRNGCETDEAWDWTDECGDIKWAFRECRLSLSCDEARNDPEIPGADDPCGDYYDELVLRDCWNDRRHGR
jgi:hypothetical protein